MEQGTSHEAGTLLVAHAEEVEEEVFALCPEENAGRAALAAAAGRMNQGTNYVQQAALIGVRRDRAAEQAGDASAANVGGGEGATGYAKHCQVRLGVADGHCLGACQ